MTINGKVNYGNSRLLNLLCVYAQAFMYGVSNEGVSLCEGGGGEAEVL